MKQAIESVLCQTYGNTELIVVDDASTDGSRYIIENMSQIHGFETCFNQSNLGNCKSFNIGFKLSKGKYVIDLAADDQLMPIRIFEGVKNLEAKGDSFCVDFCDVELINEYGESKGTHFKRDHLGDLVEKVPSGDIYKILLERYLISTPSMMIKRTAIDELKGYDEKLSYEDFDFWVRSARNYKYTFSNQVLVKKHILSNSLSSKQYQRKNRHCLSTAIVCEKAYKLNISQEENQALLKRISYELKWALITENWEASRKFVELKKRLLISHWSYVPLNLIIKFKPPWYPLWKITLWIANHCKKYAIAKPR